MTLFPLIVFLVCVAAHFGKKNLCCAGSESACATSRAHQIPIAWFFGRRLPCFHATEPNQENGCPLQVLHTCQCRKNFGRNCNTVPTFSVKHFVEKKNPTMSGSLCSISGFISSNSFSVLVK